MIEVTLIKILLRSETIKITNVITKMKGAPLKWSSA